METPKILLGLVLLCVAAVSVCDADLPFVYSDGFEDIVGEPVEEFSCEDRSYGYYADPAHNCQVFHICLPIQDHDGEVLHTAHWSFFCGNGTLFSQDILTCAHAQYAFPCEEAESLYETSNAGFGVVPDRRDSEDDEE